MFNKTKECLGKLLILAILFVSPSIVCAQSKNTLVDIRWRIPAEQVSEIQKILQASPENFSADTDSYLDDKALPLVYILISTTVAVEVARAILAIYKDARFGGVVVSSIENKLVIENNPALPGGTIIIKDKNGSIVAHKNEQNTTLDNLITSLIGIYPGSSK